MNREQWTEYLQGLCRRHEEWLNQQGPRIRGVFPLFARFTVDVEGRSAVIRGLGGSFEVRIPVERLFEHDGLRRCGF